MGGNGRPKTCSDPDSIYIPLLTHAHTCASASRTHNLLVPGSNPGGPTNFQPMFMLFLRFPPPAPPRKPTNATSVPRPPLRRKVDSGKVPARPLTLGHYWM
jgi:hypothetical protein